MPFYCWKIHTGRNSHLCPLLKPELLNINWISQPLPRKKKPVTKSLVPILTLCFLSSNNRCLFTAPTPGSNKYCYPSTTLPLICPGNFCVLWIEAKCVSLPLPERRVPPQSQARCSSPSAHNYRWFGFH